VRTTLPKPVIELPGERPRSPVIMVEPVLVMVEAPRTAKLSAEPSGPADATDGLYKNAANGIRRMIRVAHL
jgi:hypothetical protein